MEADTGLDADLPCGEQVGSEPATSPAQPLTAIQADQSLVERCSAGEVAAWEELYGQCHDPLCASIRLLLGPRCGDPNLIDEIAARVWYALVDNDGRLLRRFDPSRHVRLNTYFRGLARIHTLLHFRDEHRRRKREDQAGHRRRQNLPVSELPAEVLLSDFADTLTADERRFLEEHLAPSNREGADADNRERAGSNSWQRRHRILAKFRAFFASP
jgi:hypothetical protein